MGIAVCDRISVVVGGMNIAYLNMDDITGVTMLGVGSIQNVNPLYRYDSEQNAQRITGENNEVASNKAYSINISGEGYSRYAEGEMRRYDSVMSESRDQVEKNNFPPDIANSQVKAAWDQMTEGMSDGEKLMAEIPFMSFNLSENFRGFEGERVGEGPFAQPGDDDYVGLPGTSVEEWKKFLNNAGSYFERNERLAFTPMQKESLRFNMKIVKDMSDLL